MTVRFGLPLFLVKFINKIQSSAPSPPPTPSYLLAGWTDPEKADGRTYADLEGAAAAVERSGSGRFIRWRRRLSTIRRVE